MGKRSSSAKVVLSGTGAQSYRHQSLPQDKVHGHSTMAALAFTQKPGFQVVTLGHTIGR